MPDSNAEIRHHINEMIQDEHRLRANEDGLADAERRSRLAELEVELDRCWDLLRQREAKREFHQDPDGAHERSARIVENYQN